MLQAQKMADTWPTEIVWVIMQQDQDGQKFQNIEESRAGIAVEYRRISEIQTIHNDVHQLLETDFFVSLTWARCRAITTTRLLRLTMTT